MARLKEEVTNLEAMVLEDQTLKEEMQIQEEFIRDLQQQVRNLHRDLNMKETALSAKVTELQDIHEENKLLVQEYQFLKCEYEFLKQENEKLQLKLAKLEEKLSVAKMSMEEKAGLVSSDVNVYKVSQRNRHFFGKYGNANMNTEELGLPQSKNLFGASDQNAETFDSQQSAPRTSRPLVENGYVLHEFLPFHSFGSRGCIGKYGNYKEKGTKGIVSQHFEKSELNTSKVVQNSSENMLEQNLEKTKISTAAMMKHDFNQGSSFSCADPSPGTNAQEQHNDSQDLRTNEFESIQAEIKKRENRWRQTEAKMRAELNRRMMQLQEEGYLHPERQRR